MKPFCQMDEAEKREFILNDDGNNFLRVLQNLPKSEPKPDKCIYIVGFDDSTVKIGVSTHPEKRIPVIAKQAGRVKSIDFVSKPLKNALDIESAFKKHYSEYLKNGEIYDVSFQSASKFINNLLEVMI